MADETPLARERAAGISFVLPGSGLRPAFDTGAADGGAADGGIGGGLISAIMFLFAILVATVAYVSRKRRKFPDHNLCSLTRTNASDLENPVHARDTDTADVSLTVAIPVSVLKEEEQNESKIDESQSNTTAKRTLSALTESLASSFASSSEEENDKDDEAQSLQSDEDINDDDAASKMISFINMFL